MYPQIKVILALSGISNFALFKNLNLGPKIKVFLMHSRKTKKNIKLFFVAVTYLRLLSVTQFLYTEVNSVIS